MGNFKDEGYDLRDLAQDLEKSPFWSTKEGRNKIFYAALGELFNAEFMPMTALHVLTKFYQADGFTPASTSKSEMYLALRVATWTSILNRVSHSLDLG